MHCRLRTESPRPQELEQRLQEPHGVHSPGPYLGRQRQSQPGREAGDPHTASWVPMPTAPWAHVPLYLNVAPQTTVQEGPQQEQEVLEGAGSGGQEGAQQWGGQQARGCTPALP